MIRFYKAHEHQLIFPDSEFTDSVKLGFAGNKLACFRRANDDVLSQQARASMDAIKELYIETV